MSHPRSAAANQPALLRTFRKGRLYNYWKYRYLMIMFIPAIVFYILFHYVPIYGILIAFKNYKFSAGIWGSEWAGLQHFRDLFSTASFWEVFRNTLIISFYKLVFGFPAPIILAILLNEVRLVWFKRVFQTVTYLPHFLSWIVVSGMFIQFFSPSVGPVNVLLQMIGIKPIYFMADTHWFRFILVLTDIWKGIGWGSIIYLAALTGINPELYEAATVDGAGRFARIRYITLPSLVPVITIMLIFAAGSIINDDFDQVFNLYNTAVYSVGDVISTYTYRKGLVGMEYSFATSVGLFKNVLAFVILLTANTIARKVNDYGLW
ncbi:MAG: binding-protein-dependent transport system inner rane component [Paenibacillaceae bacterium]|nr:binding-protein-dependent transport system inner rane component [Paenibacillaceae bacterium]